MSSALGYGNVTGRFYVWRFYETIHSDFPPVWGRSPPPDRQFHSFVIGGLAIAMACRASGLAYVEEDVGCARLCFCDWVFF